MKAIMRAQRRLKTRLDDIDWEEDVLLPTVEALKSGKSVLGIPEGMAFDIVVEHEDPSPGETKTEIN